MVKSCTTVAAIPYMGTVHREIQSLHKLVPRSTASEPAAQFAPSQYQPLTEFRIGALFDVMTARIQQWVQTPAGQGPIMLPDLQALTVYETVVQCYLRRRGHYGLNMGIYPGPGKQESGSPAEKNGIIALKSIILNPGTGRETILSRISRSPRPCLLLFRTLQTGHRTACGTCAHNSQLRPWGGRFDRRHSLLRA